MSQFTKNAIVDSFIKLAAKIPVEKITVKDIVDVCGVNRNTFYYYYQDVYALVEELFVSGPASHSAGNAHGTYTEGFVRVAGFALEYPKVVKNIYMSVGRDMFDSYIGEAVGAPIIAAVEREAQGMKLEARDIGMVVDFYRQALTGLLAYWIRHDMKEDPEALAELMNATFYNGIHEALVCREKAEPRK